MANAMPFRAREVLALLFGPPVALILVAGTNTYGGAIFLVIFALVFPRLVLAIAGRRVVFYSAYAAACFLGAFAWVTYLVSLRTPQIHVGSVWPWFPALLILNFATCVRYLFNVQRSPNT